METCSSPSVGLGLVIVADDLNRIAPSSDEERSSSLPGGGRFSWSPMVESVDFGGRPIP